MTHPPAGPSTPPSSPGPGRTLFALMDFMRAGRTRAAAKQAGNRGTHASPLEMESRLDRYFAQNGSERLTPRQNRRAMHKARLATKRASARAAA